MKQLSFPNVWFADEKRNLSLTKMVVLNDRGVLNVEKDFLEFKGRKLKIKMSNVKELSIARQQIPWVGYLIMNILMIIYFSILLRNMPVGYLLLTMIPILLFSNALGLIVGYSTKWVKVVYSDDNDKILLAFLADGSSIGWGGIFGGTERMFNSIKSSIDEKASVAS